MLGGDLQVCLGLVKLVVDWPGDQEAYNSDFANSEHKSHIDVCTYVKDIIENVEAFKVDVKVK